MSKRTVFTTVTPLPAGISRAVVLDMLHNHEDMMDLNPLVKERHPIAPPQYAPPDEAQCAWYSLTDNISYLPGRLVTTDVTYTCAFHNMPDGLQTHCYAPAGLTIRDRWSVRGSLPGEPASGLYLREDVDMRCHIVMAALVKKTLRRSHAVLVERLATRAQSLELRAAAAGSSGNESAGSSVHSVSPGGWTPSSTSSCCSRSSSSSSSPPWRSNVDSGSSPGVRPASPPSPVVGKAKGDMAATPRITHRASIAGDAGLRQCCPYACASPTEMQEAEHRRHPLRRFLQPHKQRIRPTSFPVPPKPDLSGHGTESAMGADPFRDHRVPPRENVPMALRPGAWTQVDDAHQPDREQTSQPPPPRPRSVFSTSSLRPQPPYLEYIYQHTQRQQQQQQQQRQLQQRQSAIAALERVSAHLAIPEHPDYPQMSPYADDPRANPLVGIILTPMAPSRAPPPPPPPPAALRTRCVSSATLKTPSLVAEWA
ncbi:hypothetical protein P8C59_000750 [Phyllachora maydis]|uniref:DUF7053 domain-containing protein n=1 Tax=Phyllachora maydis TaxID=1825666 RepID=A0AAD9M995_9PEZI|nr:hypothetical protein P8C59_000750 [Phyllachora maydis]